MRGIVFFILVFVSLSSFSQKQLVIMKNGKVVARFTEGEYVRFVLRNHRHAEGHIVELENFSMITSNDTVKFKDILKVNIKKHRAGGRWSRGVGGTFFIGGLFFLAIGQANAAIGVHSSTLTDEQLFVPLGFSAVGAAMVFIQPKYKRLNGIQYLKTIDYTSPFYQRDN
ncbi:hypothetical protein WSM22_09900 [Cytophagales bacterium WSM2-2]|nr:hypothetical protein WSM22_09900 [Cytophagales bacterium WSM2-2]